MYEVKNILVLARKEKFYQKNYNQPKLETF